MVRFQARKGPFSDNLKAAEACQLAMWGAAWIADYPDGENFMQLLYGPSGPENNARFDLPEFNRLYEQARALPDSPERTKLFDRMTELMLAYAPWRMGYHLIEDQLLQPWVRN